MRPLTPKQQAILDFVGEFSRDRGFAPSLREIGEAVGLTNVSAVRGHVAALEKKGRLRKEPDQPRSISVVTSPSLMSRIKRKLHEFAKTDEGVLHSVQYGVVLATQGLQPLLQHEAKTCLEETLNRLGTEHDGSSSRSGSTRITWFWSLKSGQIIPRSLRLTDCRRPPRAPSDDKGVGPRTTSGRADTP
jgi:hypothetical protein